MRQANYKAKIIVAQTRYLFYGIIDLYFWMKNCTVFYMLISTFIFNKHSCPFLYNKTRYQQTFQYLQLQIYWFLLFNYSISPPPLEIPPGIYLYLDLIIFFLRKFPPPPKIGQNRECGWNGKSVKMIHVRKFRWWTII